MQKDPKFRNSMIQILSTATSIYWDTVRKVGGTLSRLRRRGTCIFEYSTDESLSFRSSMTANSMKPWPWVPSCCVTHTCIISTRDWQMGKHYRSAASHSVPGRFMLPHTGFRGACYWQARVRAVVYIRFRPFCYRSSADLSWTSEMTGGFHHDQ